MVFSIQARLQFHSLVTQILIGQVTIHIDGKMYGTYFSLVRV